MRIFLAIISGPGMALMYAILGYVTFATQWHWGWTDKQWLIVITMGGIVMTFFQIIEAFLLDGRALLNGWIDAISSFVVGAICLLAILGYWETEDNNIRLDYSEFMIYTSFFVLDVVLILVIFKILKLTFSPASR